MHTRRPTHGFIRPPNTRLHQATQLQLTATTFTLTSLTNTVNAMEDRVVCTQRAILFQSQELALSRALTDLKSNTLSLRMNLLLERDEERKNTINLMLGTMEEEEIRLRTELSKTNHDFVTVVKGASIGQLLSNEPSTSIPTPASAQWTPITPPG